MRKLFLVPLVPLFLFFSGCAVQTAQTGVQTGLTALAESIDATDTLVNEHMALAGAQAREESESYEAFRAAMYPWWQILVTLETAMGSTQVAQEALDVWVATGVMPEDWGPFCDELGEALDRVVVLLGVVGVNVPGALEEASPYIGVVCNIITDWAGVNP